MKVTSFKFFAGLLFYLNSRHDLFGRRRTFRECVALQRWESWGQLPQLIESHWSTRGMRRRARNM